MTIPNDYEYFEEVILHILFLWKDRGFQKSGQLQLIYVTNIHNLKTLEGQICFIFLRSCMSGESRICT